MCTRYRAPNPNGGSPAGSHRVSPAMNVGNCPGSTIIGQIAEGGAFTWV
jgi:hypothetical protein